jgi:hypothetical protein
MDDQIIHRALEPTGETLDKIESTQQANCFRAAGQS